MPSYLTADREASDEFTEKRSRFIGYIRPVTSVDEANVFISEISKKHYDAKHNVYAYVLRDGIKKYSDDGEPQGTAGVPVLDVIEKNGLCDVCIVVTRYFGGILLGGGGLVRAYSHAAGLAVEAGGTARMVSCDVLGVECDYGFYSRLLSLIAENDGTVEESSFTDSVSVKFCLPCDITDKVSNAVFEASSGKYMPKKLEEKYIKKNLKNF